MILLTSLNGERLYLNPGLIELIEMVPDTLVTMTNGKKYLIRESGQEVASGIEDYRVKILSRSMDPLNLCANIDASRGGRGDSEE